MRIMGGRPVNYDHRLEDLQDTYVLRVRCFQCDHVGTVRATELKRLGPPYQRLKELRERLKCRRCGNQTMNSWRIFDVS